MQFEIHIPASQILDSKDLSEEREQVQRTYSRAGKLAEELGLPAVLERDRVEHERKLHKVQLRERVPEEIPWLTAEERAFWEILLPISYATRGPYDDARCRKWRDYDGLMPVEVREDAAKLKRETGGEKALNQLEIRTSHDEHHPFFMALFAHVEDRMYLISRWTAEEELPKLAELQQAAPGIVQMRQTIHARRRVTGGVISVVAIYFFLNAVFGPHQWLASWSLFSLGACAIVGVAYPKWCRLTRNIRITREANRSILG